MFKAQKTPKILTDVADQIVDLLMGGDVKDEKTRFEIGKKLFLLEKAFLKKPKHIYKILSEEILKQLPNQEGISEGSLSEMYLFHKAKSLFMTKFGDKTL